LILFRILFGITENILYICTVKQNLILTFKNLTIMADTMLSFKNNDLANDFLSMDDLQRLCPAAFKTEPTNPNVSGRYIHANTATVVEDLAKLGWYPTQAKQCRPKKNSSGIRSFHMISFQNPDVKICKPVTDADGNTTEVVDSYPRIILTNSHDGFNSFKFMVGLFRLVCSNGLVLCSDEMVNMSIRHVNYDFETLRLIVTNAIEQVPYIVNTMNTMKNTVLSEDEKKELATAVVKIRKEADENQQVEIDEKTIMDILMPVRDEDEGDDLWTVFNVCQEKLIKGGFQAVGKNNKSRKQRSITSIKKDMDYNQRLWEVATRLMPATVAA
jgi:hypothetical protein